MKAKAHLYQCLPLFVLMLGLAARPACGFVTVTVTPGSQTVLVGSNAVFTAQVTTTAGEGIISYAWLTSPNGSNSFSTVAGAINPTCTLTNVQTTNDGYYFARVTYASNGTQGLVSASSNVRLVVNDQARIIAQPQPGGIRVTGSNVTFSVSALGEAPLSYQWRLNGTNLSGPRVTGADGPDVTISDLLVTDTGSYTVVVTNRYAAATSQVAALTVYAPPTILAQPVSATNIAGSNATFSVTPSGSAPLRFRWQKDGNDLSNGGRISGATNSTLTIAATTTNDTGSYQVVVTNIVGAVTSDLATLTIWVPATFTSPSNVTGRQGAPFSFTLTATGTEPITYGVDALPEGLSLEPTDGIISGMPVVTGLFNVTIFATNPATTMLGEPTTNQLAMTLTTGAPGITSATNATGKQGNSFTYTITASNSPTTFTADGLPAGLNLNPDLGTITGVPIVSGVYVVTLGVTNQWGWGSRTLTLNLSSAVPVITSARTATWTENRTNFSYTIRASNTPTQYGAEGLPLGLTVNTNTGVISGTPLYGGTFTIPIRAINAWGAGMTNLALTIGYATVGGLAITDCLNTWSKPYLLDFSFSLRDGEDPGNSQPVVVHPSLLQVQCFEGGQPVPSETAIILENGDKKQLKSIITLDYTYSMFSVAGAIDAMQAAAKLLINQEPSTALFGISEFHADYETPQIVTTNSATTNIFIGDKAQLGTIIDGIQDNYVQGNYAGTRAWDAMYAALSQFGPTNRDERRCLVVMTDGNDDSSLLNETGDAIGEIISLAQDQQVRIYCVGFGSDVNTNALDQLTSQTSGHYYLATTPAQLTAQFQQIVKDIDGQYWLRWATLKRANIPANPSPGFQPSFQITYGGYTATWNTELVYETITNIDIVGDPPKTNITTYDTNVVQFPYNPPDWTNDVRIGSMRLVQDADVGPQIIRLRATYVPRYVRAIRLQYRPNYPCTVALQSNGTNEILYGWSMTETNDDTGLRTLTMLSPNPTNLLTSIKYAAFGDLLSFQFTYPEALTSTQAFSSFTIDNSIYSYMIPTGQSFVLENITNFTKAYPPAPPHGTPIPWLISYGFTTNFADAELIATNGLPVWQAYLAGLNPTNASSQFSLWTAFTPGQTPQVLFNTVPTRTYQIETATSLDSWSVLRNNMPGTGGYILFIDNRNLTGVKSVFYRVGVQ